MTSGIKQKPRKPLSGGKLALLSVLATAALTCPLFVHTSAESFQPNVETSPISMRNSIFVISSTDGRTENERRAIENIYAWIELKAPAKMLSPESEVGFMEFIGPSPRFTFTHSDEPLLMPSSQNESGQSSKPMLPTIIGEERNILTRPTKDVVPWAPFWKVEMPEIDSPERPVGIVWRSDDGRRIINAPMIDEKIALEMWNKNAPSGVTALECSMFMGKMPPRVIIRGTCGNAELDMLAVVALRRHLLATVSSGGHFKSFRTDVLWNLQN